jgi:hypothetical protein
MLAISDRDRPCRARISPSSLGLVNLYRLGDLKAEAALRALHDDLAAADGDVDAAGNGDGHASDS